MRYLEAIFWGIIAALGAIVLEFVISEVFLVLSLSKIESTTELFFSSVSFLTIAAIVEESLKYVIISKRVTMFFSQRQLIIASILVGLGFFATEAFLIYGQIGMDLKIHYMEILEIALLHLSTAGIAGYFIAVKNRQQIRNVITIIMLLFIIHFAFNVLVIYKDFLPAYAIFLFLFMLIAVNIINIKRIPKKLAS